MTPRGGIHLAIYSERPSIPQVVMHKLEADGTLGEEVQSKRIDKRGVVRELEVDLIMNVDAAESIAKWLSEKVKSIRDQGRRTSGG
ncbi:MAG: hypothetical protein IID36_11735 [Planctomycetes bacterium]|nr:hypothetical protein [Planctomycetota bacterium]